MKGLGLEKNNIKDVINKESPDDFIEYDYYPKIIFNLVYIQSGYNVLSIILDLKTLK
jgi:hypothetical protein